jgi:hypothetical protein
MASVQKMKRDLHPLWAYGKGCKKRRSSVEIENGQQRLAFSLAASC